MAVYSDDHNRLLIYRLGTTWAALEHIVPAHLFLLTSLWSHLPISEESYLLGPPFLLPPTFRSSAHTFFSFKREANMFQSQNHFCRCLITVAPALHTWWTHTFAELESLWAGMMHRVRTHLFSSLVVKRSMQMITVGLQHPQFSQNGVSSETTKKGLTVLVNPPAGIHAQRIN